MHDDQSPMLYCMRFMIYLIDLFLLLHCEAFRERNFCLRVETGLRSVADEQFVFYGVVQVASELESLDVDLQEYP